MGTPLHRPGAPAHRAGHYEELNILGTPTGRVVHRLVEEWLPAAPRGFTWRLVPPNPKGIMRWPAMLVQRLRRARKQRRTSPG